MHAESLSDRHLLFGSFNAHKVHEVRLMLPSGYQVSSCSSIPCLTEVNETGSNLYENALLKATEYHCASGMPCFADDTGLEVDALGGAPGVYSAHFCGRTCPRTNMEKLLCLLGDTGQRSARFRTIIAYVTAPGVYHYFEGVLEGQIALTASGTQGFGYDPVFVPQGHTRTLAEFSAEEKNDISHRGRAFRAFSDFLARQ